MTKLQINVLEVRQLELLAIMASSDGRAAKCVKNGAIFREEYPADYAAYIAANEEYNSNKKEIARVQEMPDDNDNNEDDNGENNL